MKPILLSVYVVVTVLLIIAILLQNSKGGLSAGIGEGSMYRSRRGAERIIFVGTIALTALFLITSIANLIVR